MTTPNKRSILQLNLIRQFFAEIVQGTKTVEYRDRTDFWKKRLEGKQYDFIQFRNGYAAVVPEMHVEILGIKKIQKFGGPVYAIQLGKILKLKNWNRKTNSPKLS